MDVNINNKSFPKTELLELIKNNKLQTIIHIRNIVNIGLKDTKEIVENLESNPNYYDNVIIKKPTKAAVIGENISVDVQHKKDVPNSKESKVGAHVIQPDNRSKKNILVLGFIILIGILVYSFFKQG